MVDENGKTATNIKELTDEQILEHMTTNVLAAIKKNGDDYYLAHKDSLDNLPDTIGIDKIKPYSLEAMKEGLTQSMQNKHQETQLYWNAIEGIKTDIDHISDQQTKGWFSDACDWIGDKINPRSIDETPYGPLEYADQIRIEQFRGFIKNNLKKGAWCGPWVASYLFYIRTGITDYYTFEDYSSYFFNKRPMYPSDFRNSMYAVCQKYNQGYYGYIGWFRFKKRFIANTSISDEQYYQAKDAYDHVKEGRPIIRLCWKGDEMHWTLCYRTKQTGNTRWRNYYFGDIDNDTSPDCYYGSGTTVTKQLDWWAYVLKIKY